VTIPRRRVYVDASMASVHLLWTFDARVSPSTIRTWGERGQVSRLPRGRFRYDLDEVIEHARRMGLLGDR
jgi:hypothetical protein